jgi:hypothetical protein
MNWSSDSLMNFNVDKCGIMQMKSKNLTDGNYYMGDHKLKRISQEKDLGVLVDSDLKFSSHIAGAASRANRVLGMIRRGFQYLDGDVLKLLFTSLVRPLLEYGNLIWHPRFKKDAEILEKVQRRATKLVASMSRFEYEERLKMIGLPSLYYRRARGDAIETYKYLHNYYDVDVQKILPLALPGKTRGHSLKLTKRNCRTGVRQNSFGFRVVNLWNSLPEDVVSAPSVNAFKSRFDKHYRDRMTMSSGCI